MSAALFWISGVNAALAAVEAINGDLSSAMIGACMALSSAALGVARQP